MDDNNKVIILKCYCKSEEEIALFSVNVLSFSLPPIYLCSSCALSEGLCKCLMRHSLGSAPVNAECVHNSLQNLNLGFWQGAFLFYYTIRRGKSKLPLKASALTQQTRVVGYHGCNNMRA